MQQKVQHNRCCTVNAVKSDEARYPYTYGLMKRVKTGPAQLLIHWFRVRIPGESPSELQHQNHEIGSSPKLRSTQRMVEDRIGVPVEEGLLRLFSTHVQEPRTNVPVAIIVANPDIQAAI